MISAELGSQLESYVQQLVDSGRYGSKSEVLREGVRLIQDRETQLAALDASIKRGLADADAGRTCDADDGFNELQERYKMLMKSWSRAAFRTMRFSAANRVQRTDCGRADGNGAAEFGARQQGVVCRRHADRTPLLVFPSIERWCSIRGCAWL